MAGYIGNTAAFLSSTSGADIDGTVTADGLTVDTTTLVVDSTNNRVGIGTSSPSAELHIEKNSADAAVRLVRTGYGYTELIGSTGGSGNDFKINLNGTDRFYIQNSSGNVGIGTSSPFGELSIESASPQIYLASPSNGNVQINFNENADQLDIVVNNSSGKIAFGTSSTERMRIDSSGNVGIGVSAPSRKLEVSGDAYVTGGFLEFGGSLSTPSTANPTIYRNNPGSGPNLVFANNFSEVARFDHSGNLLVGKSSDDFAASGFEARPEGAIRITRNGNPVAFFNRLTSDGAIANFYKDGTTVGSIGVAFSRPYFASGNCGISPHNTANYVAATNSTGTTIDNTVDLGASAYRWKDLYLSGGVVFGATGGSVTSKTLDDYEEGTWTPTWGGTGSNPTVNYDVQEGRYVKIGSFVYVKLRLNITSSSGGSGTLLLNGLPFTATNDSGALGVASLGYKTAFVTQGPDFGRCNSTYIELYYDNGTAEAAIGPANLGSGTQCIFAAVYNTTQ